jgi:hypothetical protein
MKFCVTSVACEETADILRKLTAELELVLTENLRRDSFDDGIDQLTLVVVSVDDDSDENAAWATPHRKLGSFRHMLTGQRIRFLSLAAEISPRALSELAVEERLGYVAVALSSQFGARPKRLPRGFGFLRLATAVCTALSGAASSRAVA